jgi:hypothetical protein
MPRQLPQPHAATPRAELGGAVRRGEKGSFVVYANSITRAETAGEEVARDIHYLKSYSPVAQTEAAAWAGARRHRPSSASISFSPARKAENLTPQIARDCADLPESLDEALPFFRALIERHHAAMLAADVGLVTHLREEADRLAFKLNGFRPGILSNDDSPGNVLDRETRAVQGKVPLWGQSGSFVLRPGFETPGWVYVASRRPRWPSMAGWQAL